jgi:Ca2+-binding EF-hand superfamily protein
MSGIFFVALPSLFLTISFVLIFNVVTSTFHVFFAYFQDSNGAVSMQEFEDAIQKRKPKGSAGDAAWEAILRAVSEDPKVWTRSVEMLFLSFDRDGSGEVNVSELGKGLTPLGVHLTKSQLVALIKELDTNGSGTISLAEFTKAVKSHQQTAAAAAAAEKEEEASKNSAGKNGAESAWNALLEAASGNEKTWTRKIEALFLAFDRDGNGNVDIAELAAGFKSSFNLALAPEQVKGLSADLDQNGDGTINLEEFMRAVNEKRGGGNGRILIGSNSDVSSGSGGGNKTKGGDEKKPANGVKPLPGSRAAGGPGIVASRRGDGNGGPKEKALDEAWGKILGVIDEDPKVRDASK